MSLPRRGVTAHAVEQRLVEAVGELLRVRVRTDPRVRPVRGRQRQQRGRRVLQVGAQPAELASLAEVGAEALLVAAPLRDELVAALTLEVTPLTDEDRCDIELLGDDPQVRA